MFLTSPEDVANVNVLEKCLIAVIALIYRNICDNL